MAHESYDLTNLQCKYGSKSWEKPKGSNISESLYERAIGEALKTQNALLGMSYQPTARAESHTLQQGSPTTEMHSEVRLQLTSPDSLSDVQLSASSSDAQHDLLTASLRAHAQRLVLAKVRSEFDHTVLTLLTLNVIYMYYIDHTLMVLLIRVSQLLRVRFHNTISHPHLTSCS